MLARFFIILRKYLFSGFQDEKCCTDTHNKSAANIMANIKNKVIFGLLLNILQCSNGQFINALNCM